MIELVLVYCLQSDAKTCTEKRVPMSEEVSAIGCTMTGQQWAQEYLREHPTFTLRSWRCEINMPRQTMLGNGPEYARAFDVMDPKPAG